MNDLNSTLNKVIYHSKIQITQYFSLVTCDKILSVVNRMVYCLGAACLIQSDLSTCKWKYRKIFLTRHRSVQEVQETRQPLRWSSGIRKQLWPISNPFDPGEVSCWIRSNCRRWGLCTTRWSIAQTQIPSTWNQTRSKLDPLDWSLRA